MLAEERYEEIYRWAIKKRDQCSYIQECRVLNSVKGSHQRGAIALRFVCLHSHRIGMNERMRTSPSARLSISLFQAIES